MIQKVWEGNKSTRHNELFQCRPLQNEDALITYDNYLFSDCNASSASWGRSFLLACFYMTNNNVHQVYVSIHAESKDKTGQSRESGLRCGRPRSICQAVEIETSPPEAETSARQCPICPRRWSAPIARARLIASLITWRSATFIWYGTSSRRRLYCQLPRAGPTSPPLDFETANGRPFELAGARLRHHPPDPPMPSTVKLICSQLAAGNWKLLFLGYICQLVNEAIRSLKHFDWPTGFSETVDELINPHEVRHGCDAVSR